MSISSRHPHPALFRSAISVPRSGLGIGALAIAAVLSGCANVTYYTQTADPPRALAPRTVESVEVFTLSPPTRAHTIVGIIQSQPVPFPKDASVHGLLVSARTRAAQLGCDAILISSIDRLGGEHHSGSVQAGCVVFTTAPSVASAR